MRSYVHLHDCYELGYELMFSFHNPRGFVSLNGMPGAVKLRVVWRENVSGSAQHAEIDSRDFTSREEAIKFYNQRTHRLVALEQAEAEGPDQ